VSSIDETEQSYCLVYAQRENGLRYVRHPVAMPKNWEPSFSDLEQLAELFQLVVDRYLQLSPQDRPSLTIGGFQFESVPKPSPACNSPSDSDNQEVRDKLNLFYRPTEK